MTDYLRLLKEAAGEEMGDSDLHSEIIKYFMKNPKPSDDEVHALAGELGLDEHELERHIYMILGDILTEGKSKGFTGNYDPEQMRMGREVEYEHTTIPEISDKISRDHLAEIPDYYTRLAEMERAGGVEGED